MGGNSRHSLHDNSLLNKVILIHSTFSHHLDGHIHLALPLASDHTLEGEKEGKGEGERGKGRGGEREGGKGRGGNRRGRRKGEGDMREGKRESPLYVSTNVSVH